MIYDDGVVRLRTVIVLLTAPVVFAASCALTYFENEPDPPTTSVTGSAGTGGSAGQGGSPGGSGGGDCEHVYFPPPPGADDAGGTLDFVIAVRRIYTEHPDGTPIGIDLDATCTCWGQGPSCVGPPPLSLPPFVEIDECDLEGARDNNFSKAIAPLAQFLGTSDLLSEYSQQANLGEWSLLLRIQDYNGEPTDGQVRLSFYLTNGVTTPPAQWGGGDSWKIPSTALGAGPDGGPDIDAPLYVDHNAFVTDGVLVATVPAVDLVMGGGLNHFAIRVTAGGIMGTLSNDAGVWKLDDGVLAGVVTLDDMFRALSSYRETAGQLICTDMVGYDVFKFAVCSTPDMRADLGPITHPCDAVSLGFGFEAEQAQLGTVEVPLDAGPGCAPDADPGNDHCLPWW